MVPPADSSGKHKPKRLQITGRRQPAFAVSLTQNLNTSTNASNYSGSEDNKKKLKRPKVHGRGIQHDQPEKGTQRLRKVRPAVVSEVCVCVRLIELRVGR